MIVELTRQLGEHLDQIRRLETEQNNEDSIRATQTKLYELQPAIQKLVRFYGLLSNRIKLDDYRQRLTNIMRDLQNSKQEFKNHPRQVSALTSIQNNVLALNKDLETRWINYAAEKLQPGFEMLNLVRSLPDLKKQVSQIGSTASRLNYFKEHAPQNPSELAEFDQKATELVQWLAGIESNGLTEQVRLFLGKVLNGTATLADLNEEVLQWCKMENRASLFQIQMASNQSQKNFSAYRDYRR